MGFDATFTFNTPDATAHFARALGAALAPGDTVLLQGDLGAGKSFLARALILSLLDAPEDIPSPTFTLVQTYDTNRGAVWHADLYRLGDVSEIEEIGLTDAFDDAICLIEWPDRLGVLAPKNALTLALTPTQDPEQRILTVTWQNSKWTSRMDALT